MPNRLTYEELEKRVQELEQKESERKRGEEQLVHSHNLMDYIISHARSAIAVHDRALNYIYVSKRYLEEYKVEEQDIIGKHHYEVFPDLPQKWRDVHQRSLAGEVLSAEEDPYYREDGSVDWTHWECRPWYESNGSVGGIIVYTEVINDRKKVEEALQASEEKYKVLFESAGEVILVAQDGQFKIINSKVLDLLGFEPKDLVGKPFLDQIHPKDRKRVAEQHSGILKGEDPPGVYSFRVIDRADKTKWVEINSALIEWEESPATLNFLTDVTKQKQNEKALRESEQKFRETISDLDEGYYSCTLDGVLLDHNRAFNRILGFDISLDLKSTYLPDFWQNPDDRKEYLKELTKKGTATNYLINAKTIGGDNIFVIVNSHIVEDENHEPMRIDGTLIDYTERRQAEEALFESEERLRTIIEASHDAMIVINIEGLITLFNPASEKVFKRRKEEILGRGVECLMPKSYRSQHKKDIDSFFSTGLPNGIIGKTIEVPAVRANGEEFPIELSLSKGGTGKEAFVVGILRDVTERKRAKETKKQLEKQLQQSQKLESIGNLAGGIAHDFNNILSSIIGFTELALDDVKEGTVLEDNLQEVYTAGKRAKDLVKQILAFARQSDEELRPIQVGYIVKEVLKLIRSTIPTTIEIKGNIESDSLITGNSSQVHQLFMNLCTNAAQAMEDTGGILEIGVTDVTFNEKSALPLSELKSGNYIKATVSDTGPGIPPNIIRLIFDPYFTTKDIGEGTGMGLAMVHGIVETYDGKITVDSELGQGTTFSIYLPITQKSESYRQYEKETLPSGTERILLVDDEFPIAKMGSQILERLGYRVTARTSSIEALEQFRSKPDDFDLVITDMTMPNMTGDELAMELIAFRPDIPVILCTGYSKKISDEKAAKIGIRAFAYKPVVTAELAKTVRKVLDEAKT